MNDGRGTRYEQVLEGAAQDEARKRQPAQKPDAHELRALTRYVRQVARNGGYAARLHTVMTRDRNTYHLTDHQWELIESAMDNEGVLLVARGDGRAITRLMGEPLKLVEWVRGRYILTVEGWRIGGAG